MTGLPPVDFHVAHAITDVAKAVGDGPFTMAYGRMLEAVAARFAEELRGGEAGDLATFLQRLVSEGAGSQAQLFQDLWALHETGGKRDGFFVEFGAADGVGFSNTYLLERRHGWRGILAEPNPAYWDALARNRSSVVARKCVYPGPATTRAFRCTEDGHFSTLADFVDKDQHADRHRSTGFRDIDVETIALHDLLVACSAPELIDYMSIDTEGSELDILSEFPFEKWDVRLLTIEHNYTDNRQKIFELLASHGYVRKFQGLSRWDDWYVRQST